VAKNNEAPVNEVKPGDYPGKESGDFYDAL
jgi:hypothetical protein